MSHVRSSGVALRASPPADFGAVDVRPCRVSSDASSPTPWPRPRPGRAGGVASLGAAWPAWPCPPGRWAAGRPGPRPWRRLSARPGGARHELLIAALLVTPPSAGGGFFAQAQLPGRRARTPGRQTIDDETDFFRYLQPSSAPRQIHLATDLRWRSRSRRRIFLFAGHGDDLRLIRSFPFVHMAWQMISTDFEHGAAHRSPHPHRR